MRFGFVGPSYASESLIADAQRCVNWYPELIESGKGKSPVVLYPTPGTSIFCTGWGSSAQAPVRAMYAVGGRCFAVAGDSFLEIEANANILLRGNVALSASPASIAGNLNQLLITSGGSAYTYDMTTNVLALANGLVGPPSMCAYSDGYYIVLVPSLQKFQISALNDATSWDAADSSLLSVFNDTLNSMIVDHREIWFFGAKNAQVYYNSGNPDFPWEPIAGAFIEQGISAAWTPTRVDNSILWLGGDERGGPVAWRAQGYTPARISNHAVENEWQSYATHSDAVSYGYQDKGHSFWVLYFPSAKKTWVYDASTGLWHERGFWHQATATYEAHHSRCHAYAFGKHLVGDAAASGNILELSRSTYTDIDGDPSNPVVPVRRMRRAPHLSAEQEWIYHQSLQVDCEVGLAAPGDEPKLMLRWSDDGGKTWSNDHWSSAGKTGEYLRRVRWQRLGRSRDRIYEVVAADPLPWRVMDAYLKAEAGE